MGKTGKIVTVGLCPCWDIICRGGKLDWGQHRQISSVTFQPAGKALNISRALVLMGQKNTAAGLWGKDDYAQMLQALKPHHTLLNVKFTAVKGSTRSNVTVVDTTRNREMHLRTVSSLASKRAFAKLRVDLQLIVSADSVCVFAGAMPEEHLHDVVGLTDYCRRKRARLAVDTYGEHLRQIVDKGGLWVISPNVAELSQLLGAPVPDTHAALVKAANKLLDKVEIVLISRGKKGAVVVTSVGAWQGRCLAVGRKLFSTVGSGDYLLAGFLKGLNDSLDIAAALKQAIKLATAKTWGWTEIKTWNQVKRQVKVNVHRISDKS